MADERPKTREEAIEQAREWGHTRSHWNYYAQQVENPAAAALCAFHDAQEVVRLVALAQVLPAKTGPEGTPAA